MDALLTTEDVAGKLQVSVAQVKLWVAEGRIPSVKLGRLRRFRPEDIERWISDLEAEEDADSVE